MKRFLVLLAAVLCTATIASAQVKVRDYVPSLGAQFGARFLKESDTTGFSTYKLVGLHTDFYLNGTLRARVLANASWNSKGKFAVGVSADGHLLLNIADALDVYPLVGVSTAFHPGTSNWFSVGIEGGLGIEYNFNDAFGLFAEAKYQKLWISPMKGFESYIGFTYTF
jgi:hypothetical protein